LMGERLFEVLLTLISSGTLVAVTQMFHDTKNYRQNREAEERQRAKIQNDALQALLKDNLDKKFSTAVQKGGATLEERDEFGYIYERYHALGQNGVMDEKKEQFYELPIIKKGE